MTMAKQTRPEFSHAKGSELSLSGPAMVEILRAVLQKGAPVRFQVQGFSMSPFIKNKDAVTLSPLKRKKPGLGHIIAFVQEETGGLCIHRVVGKKRDSYVTKGDNVFEMTECVPGENVLGFVTGVERAGRKVLLGLGPERWLIAFLGCRWLFFCRLFPLWKILRPFLRSGIE